MSDLIYVKTNKQDKVSPVLSITKKTEKTSLQDFLVKQEVNFNNLQRDIEWLSQVIKSRIADFVSHQESKLITELCPLSDLDESGTYQEFITNCCGEDVERLLIILCIVAEEEPDLLIPLVQASIEHASFTYVAGGVVSKMTNRFHPTLRTISFLLGGTNKAHVNYYKRILEKHSFIYQDQICILESMSKRENNTLDALITMDEAYIKYFYGEVELRLDQLQGFPASLLETNKTWDDLVLYDQTIEALAPLKDYVDGMNNFEVFENKLKPGYISLFHGLPGTGKTLTASVLGKSLGVDTYIVNLSQVVSKYIGETEKNLDKIFNRLGHTNNILFFDEADALFGKRSEVNEAKDRYANQEVAYLLQRIEKCSCLVILASNFKKNMDDAFSRRILTDVEFYPPEAPLRLQHWQNGLPSFVSYESDQLVESLAQTYALTGASIANILKKACLRLHAKGETSLTLELLKPLIQEEYIKEQRNPNIPDRWPEHFYNRN